MNQWKVVSGVTLVYALVMIASYVRTYGTPFPDGGVAFMLGVIINYVMVFAVIINFFSKGDGRGLTLITLAFLAMALYIQFFLGSFVGMVVLVMVVGGLFYKAFDYFKNDPLNIRGHFKK